MIVAEFIVLSESVEAIVEPLKILQTWNPSWNPQYFITDYSDAEIAALEVVFHNVVVHIYVISIVSRLGQDGFMKESMI